MWLRIIEQNHCAILETRGHFSGILESGWHIVWPTNYLATVDLSYIDQENNLVDDEIQVIYKGRQRLDIPPYRGLSKDNLPIFVDLALEVQITDMKKVCYDVDQPFLLLQDVVSSRVAEISTRTELNVALKQFDVFQKELDKVKETSIEEFGIKIHKIIIQSIKTDSLTMNAFKKVTEAQHAKISQLRLTEIETEAMKVAQESKLAQIQADMEMKQKQSECDANIALESFKRKRDLEEQELAWKLEVKSKETELELQQFTKRMKLESDSQAELCKALGESYSAYAYSNALPKMKPHSKIVFMPHSTNCNVVPFVQS